MSIELRAREIAEFLGIPEVDAITKLSRGFGELHNEVTADFRRCNPQTDAELLEWYRTTEAYIWELTAYHLDPGFNYSGMCEGIATRLKNEGADRILCLGDGIGDLSITIKMHGIESFYHDLSGSKTADFARCRFGQSYKTDDIQTILTTDWSPEIFNQQCPGLFDAIVSLDFLEHVTDLPLWINAIYAALKPGGLLCAQNAFGCGSGPDGAMPMHLARNDRFVTDWDPLLSSIGFVQESSNWYRKLA